LSISSSNNLGNVLGDVTLAGGVLATTADLSINNNVKLTSNGEIHVADTTTTTLAGVISGAQGLTKEGSGTLTLSGANANTYLGGTSIYQGTLALSSLGAIGSGDVTLAGGVLATTADMSINNNVKLTSNGEIHVADTTTTTLEGVISGAQGLTLTKKGLGTLTLSGANTYSGGTTLNAGVLSIAPNSSLGSGTVSLNGGSLVLEGTFSAPNRFTVVQNATITSSGATELTGTLAGSDGIKLTLAKSASGLGSNSLTNIEVNGTDQFTITGLSTELKGSSHHTTTKSGEGTLVLVGENQLDPITVSKGTLAVFDSLTASVTVGQNATLFGTGTITGSVTNSGTVSPGTLSPVARMGTLTITENYSQEADSFYENKINLTTSDKLIVQGTLTIDPNSTFLLSPDPKLSPYITGTRYTVIQAETIASVLTPPVISSSPLINGFLFQEDNNIILELGLREISLLATHGNGKAVASALDTIGSTADSSLNGIFASILLLSEEMLNNALTQMHPALYKGIAIVQENNAVQVQSALTQRLQGAFDQTDECTPGNKQSKTHLWAAGVGDFIQQASTTSFNSPQIGYRANSSGFVSGIDYQLAKNFYMGALGAYTHSNVTWQNKQGQGEIDSGYAGLYLAAIGKLFYGHLSVVGAWSGYDAHRNITFDQVNETASNCHRGEQLTSHFDMGLNLTAKGVSIRPFDSFDIIVQREHGFTEVGASEYNLIVKKMNATLLRNELGVNVASTHCFKGATASLGAKLGWIREMRMNGQGLEAEFADTYVPSFFTVNSYFPNRNLLSVGASMSAAIMKERLTCTLYYNGALGEKYSDHGVGGQLSFSF
jgi:autotransporter-associated beta strand protein